LAGCGAQRFIDSISFTAHIYDPLTNSWSQVESPSTARIGHTATLLTNGRVLIAGGTDSTTGTTSSAELYDPVANAWSTAGNLQTAREWATATLLPNGTVLVVGGYFDSTGSTPGVLASSEIYDPVANAWSAGSGLSVVRAQHAATLLPNGTMLVEGGFDGSLNPVNSSELYWFH
jgi:N-acetylneuraminic acid mutarotase